MPNKYIFKRQYTKHESSHRINLRSYRDSCHVIACPFTQLRVVTDAKTSGIVGRDTRFPRVICESWHWESRKNRNQPYHVSFPCVLVRSSPAAKDACQLIADRTSLFFCEVGRFLLRGWGLCTQKRKKKKKKMFWPGH